MDSTPNKDIAKIERMLKTLIKSLKNKHLEAWASSPTELKKNLIYHLSALCALCGEFLF